MDSYQETYSLMASSIPVCFTFDDTTIQLENLFIKMSFLSETIEFDTSRLEMGAVADLFDRNGEGLIDWQEFIAALRPDWQERKAPSDADKIHDEVKRLVMLCTCRQKFRVFQVGEGKYRVNILRILLLFFFCFEILKTRKTQISGISTEFLFAFQFGDSQKLRLVRILRSTVMVRVGGGWVALDEFLVKNDPCRGMYSIQYTRLIRYFVNFILN